MSFEKIFHEYKIILTEGAIVERLKTEYHAEMDVAINHAGLIYNEPHILELLYRQYIEIGEKHNIPIMIMTPTRRVNSESIKDSNFRDKNIIRNSCAFLNKIKDGYDGYAKNILIGGLLGCRGDAYCGREILNIRESYSFHKHQTIQFQKEKVDFLFAGIMPEINEAIGMAKAMAETNIPYIISFMIRNEGCLLDGTSISEAIKRIDEHVIPKPICFMCNCVHPTNLIIALSHEKNSGRSELKRMMGIQANASILSPDELNNCHGLQQDDFSNLVDEMHFLQQQFHFKIFGGCCGTNDVFINRLCDKIKITNKNIN
ncbi:MAG: homocysteine S-methyltransferase family protein [Bacteroidetes bacterium]|nr:homocysteine S-methyltransferase family protein [Bacteroidota bacterium]